MAGDAADASTDGSRLGALLSALQSMELLADSAAEQIFGTAGGWGVVTILEAWKALCRLRLISASSGELLALSIQQSLSLGELLLQRCTSMLGHARTCPRARAPSRR